MPQPVLPKTSSDIRLFGEVDDAMLHEFFRQQSASDATGATGALVLELMTNGGEADTARRIALEIRLWRDATGRDFYFLGKTCVFSAGVTIMSAFPTERRFLTRDTWLLIHERKLTKKVRLNGSLRSCMMQAQDLVAEIESGMAMERAAFAALVVGSKVTEESLMEHVMNQGWYMPASEAVDVGLVAGMV
jgi:ATP-dependent Clp protease protease subunit